MCMEYARSTRDEVIGDVVGWMERRIRQGARTAQPI